MGDTIWVDVRGRSKSEVPADNSMLLRFKDDLDRLSKKLGVARLSDFHDYSALEEAYGDLVDELGSEVPGESAANGGWHDSKPALDAVRALRSHLASHPGDLGFEPTASRAHWPAALMEELEHCESVLADAVTRRRQFRLLIVP